MSAREWNEDRDVSCLLLLGIFFTVSLFTFTVLTIWLAEEPNGARVHDTLKFVLVVTRHGNRGTLMTIPNDPYPINDNKLWPYGLGALTPHGRVQMFNMGTKIRSLYDGFLDPKYDTSDFYASSTAIDRTLLSGEAFLAGLYPPTVHNKKMKKKFPSQLIPLYSNSLDKTLEAAECAKVLSIRAINENKFYEENTAVINGLNEYLNQHQGMNATGVTGFFPTWDTIMCESTEGYSLPSWMEQIFPHPLVSLAGKYYVDFVAGTDNLVRLIAGDFYQDVVGVMKSKIEGTMSPDRKMHFYSGHDFTLIALQAILGIPKSSIIGVVKPGSAMIFELHKQPNEEEFSIQAFYIDGSSEDLNPTRLEIPNCNPISDTCYFHNLVNNTQRFTNSLNFEAECLS